MDAAEVAALALELPGVELREHSAWTSLRVSGRGFGWVQHVEDTAMVKSTHLERDAMVGSDPETFSAGWASSTTAWVSVDLSRVDREEMFEVLAEAWRMTAGKRAVAAWDAERGW